MDGYWIVRYGCSKWMDQDDFREEAVARAKYEQYCVQPPLRGGERAKWVSLFDTEGNCVAGFAAGGPYGKVQ